MPETFYTSSQYYNLFFQVYFNRGLPMPLKELYSTMRMAPWGWPSRGGAVLYRLSPQLGEDPPC